jgi:hypothetical protein
MKTGVELIAEERQRQIEVEGWSKEHDEAHKNGELSIAAACYAVNKLPDMRVQALRKESGFFSGNAGDRGDRGLVSGWYDAWPFNESWDKRYRHDRLRSLIAAGALIAAEIDRLNAIQNQKTLKNKTAVQLLIDTINRFPSMNKEWIISQCEEVKHEEKKQIIDAVVWFDDTGRRPDEIKKEVEKYYNETYIKQHEK